MRWYGLYEIFADLLLTYVKYGMTDDNECAVSNICRNGTCTNVEGGFECDCTDGFAPGPMQICEDVDSIFCPFKHGEHERFKKLFFPIFVNFFNSKCNIDFISFL